MADFSLTTLFVVPTTAVVPVAGTSTQDLVQGQFGAFKNDYKADTAALVAAAPYFYFAQGRQNTYLQGSKRSDKIKGCTTGTNCNSNITEVYKVLGCGTSAVQITDISNWKIQCGDVVTITLRAHSSYIDTLYFNGLTRSVTVQAPCCACTDNPCTDIDTPDIEKLVDKMIAKLQEQAPGNNPDNSSLNNYYTFERIGTGKTSILRISGKALTKYGVPCDVAAFPYEYDRMWFRTFVYEGPATTVDFIVADNCNIVATSTIAQRSSYPTGTPEEIKQLEKNYYSYQAGYLKHLYRMAGYNQNFETYVVDAIAGVPVVYDTYYIKFNEFDRSAYQWGDYIQTDQMVIIANAQSNTAMTTYLDALVQAINSGVAIPVNNVCITTTSTSSTSSTSTTSTSTTLIP